MVLKQNPFDDLNGNGRYDAGEPPVSFVDLNGNGIYDSGEPPTYFVDLNGDGVYDLNQPTILVPTNLTDVNSEARGTLQTAEPLPLPRQGFLE